MTKIMVVGAGIAGLIAGRELQKHGFEVQIVDKGRGVGGRLATRRIEDAVFDHGAQYFTVREPRFAAIVEEMQAAGIVSTWGRGFTTVTGEFKSGEPRYYGTTGMTAIAKYLAQGLPILLNEQIVKIEHHATFSLLETKAGNSYLADALLLTPPVPQSLALLAAGKVELPPDIHQQLGLIQYASCLTVMALLDGPSGIPAPGGYWGNGEPIAWMGDNYQKGISPQYAVTIHAGPRFTHLHSTNDDALAGGLLIQAAQEVLRAHIKTFQVHRWRYSQPIETYAERCLMIPGQSPIVFAGDAFGGARIEGAVLSGLAAADRLVAGFPNR